jgi:hypothetical protein
MPSDSLAGFQTLNLLNKHFDKHCVIIASHVLFSRQKDNFYSYTSTTSQYMYEEFYGSSSGDSS